MAMTTCPTRSAAESPSGAATRDEASTRRIARSVSGSSPISSARRRRPSAKATSVLVAPCATWLLVRMNPSGVKTNPEPPPPPRRRLWTSTLTTAGAMRSTTPLTAREYASSSSASAGPVNGPGDCDGADPPSASVRIVFILRKRHEVPDPIYSSPHARCIAGPPPGGERCETLGGLLARRRGNSEQLGGGGAAVHALPGDERRRIGQRGSRRPLGAQPDGGVARP